MKILLIVLISALLLPARLPAQHTHFLKEGMIEFEKRVNVYALLPKALNQSDPWAKWQMENVKSKPQFKTLKSSLYFSGNKTLFSPDMNDNKGEYLSINPMAAQNNLILTDLAANTNAVQKKVYEEVFLLTRPNRPINWKITDEFREIAGFQCRRANAVIMDSVYVVAFYTDEIVVSGGPESFTGLPGMILGVALPHDHITWFATRVMEVPVPPATFTPSLKGTSIKEEEMMEKLRSIFGKDPFFWGEAVKAFLL